MLESLLHMKRKIVRRFRLRFDRWVGTRSHYWWRLGTGIGLGLTVVVLSLTLFPRPELFIPPDFPRKGDIATADIVAPFDFVVLKTQENLEAERRRIQRETPPILAYDQIIADSIQRTVALFFDYAERLAQAKISPKLKSVRLAQQFPWLDLSELPPPRTGGGWLALRYAVEDVVRRVYAAGIFPDNRFLPASDSRFVMVNREELGDFPLQREQILDLPAAQLRVSGELSEVPGVDSLDLTQLVTLTSGILTANLNYDHESTEQHLLANLADVRPYKVRIFRGERIVAQNERVTAVHAERLYALAQSRAGTENDQATLSHWLPYLARATFAGLCVLAMVAHFAYFRPRYLQSIGVLFTVAILWSIILIAARFASETGGAALYLVPIPFAAILISILLDLETGLVSTIFLSLLVGVVTGFDFALSFVGLCAGIVSAYSVHTVRRRFDFYRPALYGALVYVVTIALLESLRYTHPSGIIAAAGYGLVNAVFGAILAVGVLPVFESLFGFTTDLTLLELSNLNHPLLRRLSLEAPGTYHHSIVIGNLSEAAAEAIGAHPLLARVGSYYHDIGKMANPEYFVENHPHQRSRHEHLSPSMSRTVLKSHVKLGRELALQHDLPNVVIDFIEQHHGTTTMAYFYHKAKEQDPNVMEENFRYPGPKPQTRETAILMLADSVEAVSRTLEDPKPARLRTAIKHVIDEKFLAAQLEECNLTLRDLHLIEESFLKILVGVFHTRVKYPQQLSLDGSDDPAKPSRSDTPSKSTTTAAVPVAPKRTGMVKRARV